ncbi:hypothetical protein KC19_1G073800 [Ceratodon purpureus]|uniref:Uncharacterized protein n=1 Tax=Ceratodon purpureus TaxID=3225 RepID=A0A8T0J5Q5_CERPU|nr:hypothetical protein KC19_1G073800 [Ceratodon purpureus]
MMQRTMRTQILTQRHCVLSFHRLCRFLFSLRQSNQDFGFKCRCVAVLEPDLLI